MLNNFFIYNAVLWNQFLDEIQETSQPSTKKKKVVDDEPIGQYEEIEIDEANPDDDNFDPKVFIKFLETS